MKCILFIADAVRPDYLGCYGDTAANTPAIDYLASHGVRFETAITAAPWTAPSTASLISGLDAYRHRIFTWNQGFPEDVYTLFHAFAEHSHVVGSFVFDQDLLFNQMPFANVQGDSHRFNQVCQWLDHNADRDFFLYVHSWATHMPTHVHHADGDKWKTAKQGYIELLQTGEQAAVTASQASYRRAIEDASANQVGELINVLQDRSILDETLFIFLSDHGESWGERYQDKQKIQGLHSLHGHFLYDETLKVPLILHWPAYLPPSRLVTHQVRLVDLVPTILDLAGIPWPEFSWQPDGASLRTLIDGRPKMDLPALSATSELGQLSRISLRTPLYKYIFTLGNRDAEMYSLKQDPGEQHNLLSQYPLIARQMQAHIDSLLTSSPHYDLAPEEKATLIDQMTKLGYL